MEGRPRRRRLDLYNLAPKQFADRENVIEFTDLQKVYNLEGREDKVVALKKVSLSHNSEFYPVKKYRSVLQ